MRLSVPQVSALDGEVLETGSPQWTTGKQKGESFMTESG